MSVVGVGLLLWVFRPVGIARPDTIPSRAATGQTFRDCADCPEMVTIPSGRFTMGSPDSELGRGDDEVQHQVTIGKPFALGKYEVTRREFAAFAAATGYEAKSCYTWTGSERKHDEARNWRDPGFPQTEDDPAVCVSWVDARRYIDWLSRTAGLRYRLASEAEWEYAARAGTKESRFWGEDPNAACASANVADETAKAEFPAWAVHACADGYVYTAPVGTFPPNGFGLCDMLGNVWEWVEDCYGPYASAPVDGSAAPGVGCSPRVVRGGSWNYDPMYVRSAFRIRFDSTNRYGYVGFRVARTLP
jgi:formylglycine-generating enzyme required for sulfatase activity